MADLIPQPHGLIQVLLNARAPISDRDDAAMDLAAFDGADAESALAQVALDPQTNPDLIQTAAESLAEIWSRLKRVDWAVLEKLNPGGRQMAVATLLAADPELQDTINAKLGNPPLPGGASSPTSMERS